MAGVGEQREAVGEDAAGDLDDRQRRGQREDDRQRAGAAVPRRVVIVVVAVDRHDRIVGRGPVLSRRGDQRQREDGGEADQRQPHALPRRVLVRVGSRSVAPMKRKKPA